MVDGLTIKGAKAGNPVLSVSYKDFFQHSISDWLSVLTSEIVE